MTPTSPLVLVTGITGFIGSHCAAALLQRGYRVRGSLRSASRAESIRQAIGRQVSQGIEGLEFAEADLTRDAGWTEAAAGCTYVLHVASPVPTYVPKDPMEIIRPAVEGTRRVLRAAARSGVKRTVLTSSTAAVVYGDHRPKAEPYTESDWTKPEGPRTNPYIRSKLRAERAAWDFMDRDDSGMELSAVNPGLVLGPVLEKDYGSSGEVVYKILKGDFPGLPRLGFPLTDVRDVAQLHVLAMERPEAAGERFICGNAFWHLSQIADTLRAHFPDYAGKIPKRELPSWLVRLFALRDPETRSVLVDLNRSYEVSQQKAKDRLGFAPRSNEEAVISMARSMIELGIV